MTEKKTGWTPGPWFVEGSTSRQWSGFRIHSSSETYDFDTMSVPQSVAITTLNYDRTTLTTIPHRQEANAHLIAAAPELYDALEGIVHFADALNHRTDTLSVELRRWIAAGETALVRAKGEREGG